MGTSVVLGASGQRSAVTGSATVLGVSTGAVTGGAYPSTYFVPTPSQWTFSDVVDPVITNTSATWRILDGRLDAVYTPGAYYYGPNFRITWANQGGDWYDTNGTPQGTSPFGSVAVALGYTGYKSATVTSLVQAFCNGTYPNYGFMVKSSGSNTVLFYSRFDATASNRPVLTVNGTPIEAGRSVRLSPSTSAGLGGQTTVQVSPQDHTLLWFDLSAFMGQTITSATITIYVNGTFDAAGNVEFYRLWNPADQGSIDTQHLGLAQNYVKDSGIEGHADVLFVQQFTDANYATKWMPGNTAGVWQTSDDPSNGFTLLQGMNALKCTVYQGHQTNDAFDAYWSPWRGGGTHIKPLEEIDEVYVRYYLLFGNDWSPMPDPSGKLIGCDGRYAYPTKLLNMGAGNSGAGADGMCGWSARGSYDATPQSTDPLAGGSGIGFGGDYNVDASSTYGSNIWLDYNYLAMLRPAQWNSVEFHLKMNTVTQPLEVPRAVTSITTVGTVATATLATPETSPLYATGQTWSIAGGNSSTSSWNYNREHVITVVDSTHFTFTVTAGIESPATKNKSYDSVDLPNFLAVPGTGNKDGILEVWVNGRKAGVHSDLRWRTSKLRPDGGLYGIDNIWLTVYQGGASDPSKPTATAYLADIVVAKSYIGPMMTTAPSTLPTWLQGQPLNKWISIANTTMTYPDFDFTPQYNAGLCTATGVTTTYGNPSYGIMWADSGGGIKKTNSTLLLYGGGGQGGWAGNDLRGLCLEDNAPRWATLKYPTNVSQVWDRYTAPDNTQPHAWMKNGTSPNAGHSYNQLHFVENQNKFYRIGFKQAWETDNAGALLNIVAAGSIDTNAADTWDAPAAHPVIPYIGQYAWDGWPACANPTNDRWYIIASTIPGINNGMEMYDWATNSWTVGTNTIPTQGDDPLRCMTAIDPRGTGLMLAIGGVAGNKVWVYDLATMSCQIGALSGPYASKIRTTSPWWSGAIVFDRGLNCFVHYTDDVGLDSTTYLYTLTQVGTSTTFYVDRMTLTGTPPPIGTTSRGTNFAGYVDVKGRMQYVPNLNGIVIYPSPYTGAYFVKTT